MRHHRVAIGHLDAGSRPLQLPPRAPARSAPRRSGAARAWPGRSAPAGTRPGPASRQPGPAQRGTQPRGRRRRARLEQAAPAGSASRARDTSMLARIAPAGLDVWAASNARSSRSRVEPLGLAATTRCLAERGQRLVCAHDHRVGTRSERMRRVAVGEAEVRAPGLVDHDRDVAPVSAAATVGDVARSYRGSSGSTHSTATAVGVLGERRARERPATVPAGTPGPGRSLRDPHRSQPGEDQPENGASVRRPGHEHGVPGLPQREHERLVGVRRAAGRVPAPVRTPELARRGARRARVTPPVSLTVSRPP